MKYTFKIDLYDSEDSLVPKPPELPADFSSNFDSPAEALAFIFKHANSISNLFTLFALVDSIKRETTVAMERQIKTLSIFGKYIIVTLTDEHGNECMHLSTKKLN